MPAILHRSAGDELPFIAVSAILHCSAGVISMRFSSSLCLRRGASDDVLFIAAPAILHRSAVDDLHEDFSIIGVLDATFGLENGTFGG